MDYQVLNHVIVSNHFLILIIDELLVELYGARILSKVDLKSGYD